MAPAHVAPAFAGEELDGVGGDRAEGPCELVSAGSPPVAAKAAGRVEAKPERSRRPRRDG
jgi:hypothetical protein